MTWCVQLSSRPRGSTSRVPVWHLRAVRQAYKQNQGNHSSESKNSFDVVRRPIPKHSRNMASNYAEIYWVHTWTLFGLLFCARRPVRKDDIETMSIICRFTCRFQLNSGREIDTPATFDVESTSFRCLPIFLSHWAWSSLTFMWWFLPQQERKDL